MRRRLFVAADIDDAARAACARVAEQLRDKGWPGKWVAPETITSPSRSWAAWTTSASTRWQVRCVTRAALVQAFDVPVDTVGAFPNARKPRVAWVGPAREVPAFTALCDAVRRPLAALGFTFTPHANAHVTLARSDGRAALPAVERPRIAPHRVAGLSLYESFTERTGARYVALDRFAFAATGEP